MFDRRNIRRIYLNITEKTKDFLLSDKSREFFVFLFFFFVAGGFWLLQTLNNDYEAEFSIPVRLRGGRFLQPSIYHAIYKARPHNFKGLVMLLQRLGNAITKQK